MTASFLQITALWLARLSLDLPRVVDLECVCIGEKRLVGVKMVATAGPKSTNGAGLADLVLLRRLNYCGLLAPRECKKP